MFYQDNAQKVFIGPNPYQRVKNIPGELKSANLFFVEDVAYQNAAIQLMERMMPPFVPMKPTTTSAADCRLSRRTSTTAPQNRLRAVIGLVVNHGVGGSRRLVRRTRVAFARTYESGLGAVEDLLDRDVE